MRMSVCVRARACMCAYVYVRACVHVLANSSAFQDQIVVRLPFNPQRPSRVLRADGGDSRRGAFARRKFDDRPSRPSSSNRAISLRCPAYPSGPVDAVRASRELPSPLVIRSYVIYSCTARYRRARERGARRDVVAVAVPPNVLARQRDGRRDERLAFSLAFKALL